MGLGTTEILLIVAVLFLLFGASRLPQLAKSLGQTRKAFKDGIQEAEEEDRLEREKKNLQAPPVGATLNAPRISTLSDEELLTEMRRRAEVKQ